MKQQELDFTSPRAPRIGSCQVCDKSGLLNARICRSCERKHGRRIAELLARARRDPDFARSCYLALEDNRRADFLRFFATQELHKMGPGLRKCEPFKPMLRVVGAGLR